ncbi:CIA30 family protein [Flavobacterium sp.]|uniref:CIA30 family protein n=1 Tax=Flavobacterium sp. TaxID=239 RepID=UPI002632515C|nr:CIA30 family protein [Flavobacterium sp.]MDG2432508.1 CIA30 family protein [Flavobacterium sp.]
MILLFASLQSNVIFDFTVNSNIQNWSVVNDVVMGGASSSSFALNNNGNAVFKGEVSLENNGGFASVRYRFPQKQIKQFSTIRLRLKGDGKDYQLRLKANINEYYSYVATFKTTGEWQNITMPLENFYPSFRGRKLTQPNFAKETLEEISFLIGNKKTEQFELEIDSITLY